MLNAPGDTPPGTTSTSPGSAPAGSERPGTRAELQSWIHTHLTLPRHAEAELNAVIEHVMTRQERLWQASKDEAIKALLAGFAERHGPRCATKSMEARHDSQQYFPYLNGS